MVWLSLPCQENNLWFGVLTDLLQCRWDVNFVEICFTWLTVMIKQRKVSVFVCW